MLKKLTLIFISLSVLSAPAYASEKVNPALWLISDHDSKIWLFGTIHALDKKIKWRTPKITKALTETDTLYLEVSLDEMSGQKAIALISEYGLNKNGQSLFDLLTPETNTALQQLIIKYNLPENFKQQLTPMRPWLAALTFLNIQMMSEQIDPQSGVDQSLENEAKLFKKEIRYLETIEQQLGLFGNLSPEDDLRFFEDSITQMADSPEMLHTMLDLWKTGDTEGLADFMNVTFSQFPNLQKSFLFNRNKNWANQIDKMMKGSGNIFIAVGAGHLGGEKSVQWYLEQKGYHITRVQ